jgi:hypothetical protein
VFELDSNSNIGLSGQSTDTAFVSVSGRTFIGLLENTGFNFTWMAEITSSTQQVR